MIYSFSTTFDSEPTDLKYTAFSEAGYVPTFAYNKTAAAVDIDQPSSWRSGVVFTSLMPTLTTADSVTFEAEIEIITDYINRRFSGLWLIDPTLIKGFSSLHLDNAWYMETWSSFSSHAVISTVAGALSSNVIYKYKFEKIGSSIKFYLNDALIYEGSAAGVTGIYPGVHVYGLKVRLHSFSYVLETVDINFKSANFVDLSFANTETKTQAWPGENSSKKLESQTAEKVYGITTAAMLNAPPLRKNFGFIEGVITRKTAPAIGQHVICLDDRFNLVAETFSGAGGYYRFDSLPINGLYAIHAYDNNEYKYAPVGADRRTPEAYA